MNKKINLFKNKNNIYLFLVVSFFVLLNLYYLSSFKQLPSCYYGCDLQSHLGTMEYLSQGGSIFENAQIKDAKPWTPEFYHLIVVFFSKLLNISLISSVIYLNSIFIIVSGIFVYLLTKSFFKNENYSLLSVIILMIYFPIFKYSPFAYYVLNIIFFYLLYKFYINKSIKNSIILGFILGLIGFTNTVSFIALVFLIMMFFLFDFYDLFKKYGFTSIQKNYSNLKNYFIIALSSLPLALLYWWWPIMNKFHELNPITEYGHMNYSSIFLILRDIFSILRKAFFNYGNFYNGLISFFVIIGLLSLFLFKIKSKKYLKQKNFILILFYSYLVLASHHLITEPLFNMSIFPYMISGVILTVLKILLFFFAIENIFILIKQYSKLNKNLILKIKKYFSIFLIILFLFLVSSSIVNRYHENQYFVSANLEIPKIYQDTANWVFNNTNIEDVFLTTKENCFMLNGFTGRKCMIYRNTHTDPFIDVFKRDMDAAVILYGNNSILRNNLIKKYNISYLYWDYYWLKSEFQFDQKGRLVGFFDPIKIPYSIENELYLKSNGVKYIVKNNQNLDPTYRKGYNLYKVLIVLPNFKTQYPWADSLNKDLIEVWNYSNHGVVIERIFKLK